MRILVISDSHGKTAEIEKAIEAQSEAKQVFFLGDCVRDIEDLTYVYTDRIFHIVEGNCDGYTMYKTADAENLCGKRILFTHGHTYNVKSGRERLKAWAREQNADIVLYGHTHLAETEYDEGVYFVNPGSLCSGRCGYTSYAVIDIVEGGVMPVIIRT